MNKNLNMRTHTCIHNAYVYIYVHVRVRNIISTSIIRREKMKYLNDRTLIQIIVRQTYFLHLNFIFI